MQQLLAALIVLSVLLVTSESEQSIEATKNQSYSIVNTQLWWSRDHNNSRLHEEIINRRHKRAEQSFVYCPIPKPLLNGLTNASGRIVGAIVIYTCDRGFTTRGSRRAVCQEDGTWSSKAPACVEFQEFEESANCGNPGTIPNGRKQSRSNNYGVGTRVSYTCNNGFQLNGQSTIVCLESGEWSAPNPVCVRSRSSIGEQQFVYCPIPKPLLNGLTNASGRIVGAIVIYTCDRGFTTRGSRRAVCQEDGTWTSKAPVCVEARETEEVNCGNPGGIANGRLLTRTNSFSVGTVLTYACNNGFRLQGQRNVVCLDTGQWNEPNPVCIRSRPAVEPGDSVNCGDPGDISNGRKLTRTSNFGVGTQVSYTCNDGFQLQGQQDIVCLQSGRWSAPKPTCTRPTVTDEKQLVICSLPKDLLNGRTDVNGRVLGSVVFYTCDRGFMTNGSRKAECQEDGTWTSKPPVCVEYRDSLASVNCGDPGDVANGQKSRSKNFGVGTIITYTCNQDFQLMGPKDIVCLESGKWNEPKPTCFWSTQPKTSCHFMSLPQNMQIKVMTISGLETGYVDSLERALQILKLTKTDGVIGYEFPIGTRIGYRCQSQFYDFYGSDFQTCRKNGEWTGTIPTCLPRCGRSSVPRKPSISHGRVTLVGQWPWQAAIVFQASQRKRGEVVCGGSLVNDKWVLTAAHCVTKRDTNEVMSVTQISTYLGKYNRSFCCDDHDVQRFSIMRIIVHEDYNYVNLNSDIALLEMEKKVILTQRVQPVCLPNDQTTLRNIRDNELGVISGWGLTEKQRNFEPLLDVDLPVLIKRTCENRLRQVSRPFTVTENMYCAGFGNGSDSCTGDSGGPMVFIDGQQWVLEGIVSWAAADGCGTKNSYSGYVKVHRFISWIKMFI